MFIWRLSGTLRIPSLLSIATGFCRFVWLIVSLISSFTKVWVRYLARMKLWPTTSNRLLSLLIIWLVFTSVFPSISFINSTTVSSWRATLRKLLALAHTIFIFSIVVQFIFSRAGHLWNLLVLVYLISSRTGPLWNLLVLVYLISSRTGQLWSLLIVIYLMFSRTRSAILFNRKILVNVRHWLCWRSLVSVLLIFTMNMSDCLIYSNSIWVTVILIWVTLLLIWVTILLIWVTLLLIWIRVILIRCLTVSFIVVVLLFP